MLKTVRRIVTANDEDGLSRVWMDGAAENTITVLTELWTTGAGRADHASTVDRGAASDKLEPPGGGTLFRFFQIAPESTVAHLTAAERRQADADWFASMNGAHLQPDTRRHPAMHRSNTTDYIVLLSGEITLVLDKEERDLKPFDVVVQRNTNHAWVNRGTADALLMSVLVDDGSAQGDVASVDAAV
jgi:mannose-6-phosphate isomerase-like protein (cupin superfamily)